MRYYLVISFIFTSLCSLSGQNLKEFFIECDPEDFNYIYENYEEDIYIPVLLTFEGTTWEEVLMRIRGDSSREYPKKSLKAEFQGTPFITGEAVLNFNAEYHDISYMHSYLSSVIFQKANLDCVSMEHVRLYLNGEFLGLYLLTKNMDIDFLMDHGYNGLGNLYKARKDGACLNPADNLFYHWELKSGFDPFRDDLSYLIKNLNFTSNTEFINYINQAFDKEALLGFIVLNMLLSNGSTYYHNYYLYHDIALSNRWYLFPWDIDKTFSDYNIGYPYHRSSGFWTHDNPILERVISNNEQLDSIKGLAQYYSEEFFNPSFLFPIIDSLKNVLQSSVLEDETDNIPDLETWLAKIDADKSYITQRPDNLLNQINNCPKNFKLYSTSQPFKPGEQVEFTWSHSIDPNNQTVLYTFYFSGDVSFIDPETIVINNLTDTITTLLLPDFQGKYYWKVEATDGTNSIEGYDSYNTLYIAHGIPEIVINEINYNSANDFDPQDWVEFYNDEDTGVNLSDWRFMDEDNAHSFIFPEGTFIDSKGYIVLCRDTAAFHALFPNNLFTCGNMNFGLSGSGELIRLFHPTGYLVDSVVYRTEYPWPTEPDGQGPTLELINPGLDNVPAQNWKSSSGHGTPCEQNSAYSPDQIGNLTQGKHDVFEISPNPFTDQLAISYSGDQNIKWWRMTIYNINGVKVYERQYSDYSEVIAPIMFKTEIFNQGIYILLIELEDKSSFYYKVVKQ